MKLDFIDLGNLSIAAANMRGKGKDPDVSDLLPSIRARGVLVPLLVRPNCSKGRFEIVAGRRRFTAVNAVAREGGAVKPIPCAVKRRSKGTPDRRRRGTPFSDNMMLVC